MKKIFKTLSICFLLIANSAFCQNDSITIATWNIEHLGSDGRGFPEHQNENIGARTENDFRLIAALIKDTLQLDVVCLQEISISMKMNRKSYSTQLDRIVHYLGEDWSYYLTYLPCETDQEEMQNAFLYNTNKLRLKTVFEMDVPYFVVGEKNLFDRIPLVGHFVALKDEIEMNEFVLVNLHLASGQDNDENHLAAMVIIEQNLKDELKRRDIIEPNRDSKYALEEKIILGDFNDNPYKLKSNETCCKYLDFLYQYMDKKGYTDLTTKEIASTRMNKNFDSTIDHILVHKRIKDNIGLNKARIYYPCNKEDNDCLLEWRKIYSDHFPLYFKLEIYQE